MIQSVNIDLNAVYALTIILKYYRKDIESVIEIEMKTYFSY